MKIYPVGGYVRDKLLGREPKDIDYVVVGSSPQEMLRAGFQQVGSTFPVFLMDGCEYALARTERKTGPGYMGFETVHDSSVTLEQDLQRRDLTINSMAFDGVTGQLIDPFGGKADLDKKVLRHTSDAFSEDPVRVLRTARFAARYGFDVHDDTISLMCDIVHEIDDVPQERIWAEIQKGLMEQHPVKMFEVLHTVNAFSTLSLAPYAGVDMDALERVSDDDSLEVRFALVASQFEDEDYETCCIPTTCSTLARAINKNFAYLVTYPFHDAGTRVDLLTKLSWFSRPELLQQVTQVIKFSNDACVPYIIADTERLKLVDAGKIASQCTSGQQIKEALRSARIEALLAEVK
mgnify:CR=1 FL=1